MYDVYLFSLFHINKFWLWVKYWAFFYPKIDNLGIYSWQIEWRILCYSIISISDYQVLALSEILSVFYHENDNLRSYSISLFHIHSLLTDWMTYIYSILPISHYQVLALGEILNIEVLRVRLWIRFYRIRSLKLKRIRIL